MRGTLQKPVVLFDGVCNLCNGWVTFLLRRDKAGVLLFASLQNEPGSKLLLDAGLPHGFGESLVLLEGGKHYLRSAAVLRMTRYLAFPWPFFFGLIIIPGFIRDAVYDFIAARRYRWFGKRENCMLPEGKYRKRFLDETQ